MRTRWVLPLAFCGAMAAGPLPARAAGDDGAAPFDPPVRLQAGGKIIDTAENIGHAGPFSVDLDADGRLDLLVGNIRGTIQVYANVGTREAPEYEDRGLLQAGGADAKIPNW